MVWTCFPEEVRNCQVWGQRSLLCQIRALSGATYFWLTAQFAFGSPSSAQVPFLRNILEQFLMFSSEHACFSLCFPTPWVGKGEAHWICNYAVIDMSFPTMCDEKLNRERTQTLADMHTCIFSLVCDVVDIHILGMSEGVNFIICWYHYHWNAQLTIQDLVIWIMDIWPTCTFTTTRLVSFLYKFPWE